MVTAVTDGAALRFVAGVPMPTWPSILLPSGAQIFATPSVEVDNKEGGESIQERLEIADV